MVDSRRSRLSHKSNNIRQEDLDAPGVFFISSAYILYPIIQQGELAGRSRNITSSHYILNGFLNRIVLGDTARMEYLQDMAYLLVG